MLVRELMTESVVTVESGSSVQQAATQMLRHSVGSVIVTHAGTPAGIVTKSDILYAGVATGRPYDRIPLDSVVSHPVVTIRPDDTVVRAVAVMKENATKHLPVTVDDELKGIVTTTDIATHHRDLFDDVRRIQSGGRELSDAEGRPLDGDDQQVGHTPGEF